MADSKKRERKSETDNNIVYIYIYIYISALKRKSGNRIVSEKGI